LNIGDTRYRCQKSDGIPISGPESPSANWGQIIGYYWFYPPIIGNYWLLLQLLAIIGYYFLQNFFILLAIIATSSNINYCNYCDTIIAIIGSASNYLHYWQSLSIIDINLIIGINLN
jgi:hypothetical protein